MLRKKREYVCENGTPGREATEIDLTPPKGFCLHKELMDNLDLTGWYGQLAHRHEQDKLGWDGTPMYEFSEFGLCKPLLDPQKIDHMMCRDEIVRECKTNVELEIAQHNNRIVLSIDPACPDAILYSEIMKAIKTIKDRIIRSINTTAWTEHRILALYDLKLMGYDLSNERKQLAAWLFPEIQKPKARGDKFDKAKKYLDGAISSLDIMRAQSQVKTPT